MRLIARTTRGFALPLVLISLTIISVFAYDAQTIGLTTSRLVDESQSTILYGWKLKAGEFRTIKALMTPGDPLRESLYLGNRVVWQYRGSSLLLEAQLESRKLDVNFGEPEIIGSLLSLIKSRDTFAASPQGLGVLPPHSAPLPYPAAILPVDERFGADAAFVTRYMTSLTGQPRPERRENYNISLDSIQNSRSDQYIRQYVDNLSSDGNGLTKPVYRVSVSVLDSDLTRNTYIIFNTNDTTRFMEIRNE